MENQPPTQNAEGDKKSATETPRLVKISAAAISLFVTALLIPAFTRQWDDRQKANDVRHALVDEIASTSAVALSRASDLLSTSLKARPTKPVLALLARTPAPEATWGRQGLEIQAKLAGYFNESLILQWQDYRDLVSLMLGDADGDINSASTPGLSLPSSSNPLAERALEQIQKFGNQRVRALGLLRVNGRPGAKHGRLDPSRVDRVYRAISNAQITLAAVQRLLLQFQGTIDAEIAVAHARGFSTTWRDLLQAFPS